MYLTTENLIEAMFNMESYCPTKVKRETNESFEYLIALPGLVREDIDVKAILEKDFITVFVKIEKNSTFVPEQSIRIVKLIDEVLTDEKSIGINMENGVLKVTLTKRNPIVEFKL